MNAITKSEMSRFKTEELETTRLPKLMSIREVARTGVIPEHALRRLIKEGKIPCIYSGCKALICFDRLCELIGKGEL